jgi:malonyl CoA-acyl carrier protein transacylase
MPFDFDAIRRLPPDERIEALEKLEEELRKLIEKRNKEIKQSQQEIEEAEDLFERAQEELVVLQKIATPEGGVKIDELFFKEPQRQKDKDKRGELEETVDASVINRRRQEEYLRPQLGEAIRSFYEDKPANELSEEQAKVYLTATQPLPQAQESYRPRERKTRHDDIVSEGYQK